MLKTIQQIWALMFSASDPAVEGRSPLGNLAVPHMFQPRLTLGGAALAVFGAILRMFLASALFAVWGNYTVILWQAVQSVLLHAALAVVSLAGFLAVFVFLMIGINTWLNKISMPKLERKSRP